MGKTAIKTKKEDIVDYWFSRVNECGLSVDASEAHERCWRCGCEHKLQRCHIIPESLGGKDEPSNLVLLCHKCHLDNPNVADPEIMWDWLRAYGTSCYDTFWDIIGMKEYEFIYNKSLISEFIDLGITDRNEINEIMKSYMPRLFDKVSHHYGNPYINVATIAGIYRMLVKELAKERNKTLKDLRNVPAKYWNLGTQNDDK